jgi:hypothetical protein
MIGWFWLGARPHSYADTHIYLLRLPFPSFPSSSSYKRFSLDEKILILPAWDVCPVANKAWSDNDL